MQLTIKVSGPNAKIISHLLAKNPNNLYERTEKGSKVRLVYTTFQEEQVEVLLYVIPDAIELVRNTADAYDITQYINDREFAVSSLFCSYIRSALGTALNGKPKEEYRKWVHHEFQLELRFGPVASHLKDEDIQQLFKPMRYQVDIERGYTNYRTDLKEQSSARFISIRGYQTLQNAMKHLFVLIPVLDNYKHYFIDERENEKLERYGEGWLEAHPLCEMIIKRTLRFSKLIKTSKFTINQPKDAQTEASITKKNRLNDLRYDAITSYIANLSKKDSIVDLGSGEGKLSTRLGFLSGVSKIMAVEPSQKAQLHAMERFESVKKQTDFLKPKRLFGSLFYMDDRLCNKDVMILCEVIEHIDEYRLPKVFQTIFSHYQPTTLMVTTPNREYNEVYEMDKQLRHSDHRFEWTRQEFISWCESWTSDYPYTVCYQGIGEEHEQFGHPTQMAIFTRKAMN